MPWRRVLFPELLIPLIWGIYWWPVISDQAYLYIRDLTLFALPMKLFMLERLGAGELPLWTPHVAAGMPFLADPSNQVLYPGNILFWLLPSPRQALSWYLITHHLLAMITFTWLCRARGLGRWISVWAGIVYALAGYSLSSTDNVNFLPAVAWAPAALAAFSQGLRQTRYVHAVPGALSLACIVLAGDPLNGVIVVALWGLLGIQWMASRPATGRTLHNTLLGFAPRFLLLSVLVAMLITAVQVLPTLDLASVSIRQHGLPYAELSKWSFPVRRLLELLQPYFFASNYPTLDFLAAAAYPTMHEPWANSVYLGSLTVVLAAVGLYTSARREAPWLVLLTVTLLLSFGANTPFFAGLVAGLPFLDSQRYPEKYLFWVTLLACYFAAVGARALLCHPASWKAPAALQKPLIKIVLSAAGIIVALWGLVYVPARAWIWDYAFEVFSVWTLRLPWALGHIQILALHTLIVSAIVIGWLWLAPARRRAYVTTVLVLCVLDLFWVHYRFVPLMPIRLADQAPPPYALQFLQPRDPANPYRIYYDVYTPKNVIDYAPGELQQRVLGALDTRKSPFAQGYAHLYAALFRRDRLQVNSAIEQGLDYLNGRMSPLQPALTLALENSLVRSDPNKLMTLTGVRYVISALVPPNPAWDVDGFVTVHEDAERNLRIVENHNWLPEALLVDRARRVGPRVQDALDAITATTDVKQTLVLTDTQPAPPAASASCTAKPQPIVFMRPKPELIRLTGSSRCVSGHLLLNETYSKGWSASLNGSPVRIWPANLRFMAIALPPGPFKVEFHYRESRLLTGALLSGLGLSLCLIIGVRSRRPGSG